MTSYQDYNPYPIKPGHTLLADLMPTQREKPVPESSKTIAPTDEKIVAKAEIITSEKKFLMISPIF